MNRYTIRESTKMTQWVQKIYETALSLKSQNNVIEITFVQSEFRSEVARRLLKRNIEVVYWGPLEKDTKHNFLPAQRIKIHWTDLPKKSFFDYIEILDIFPFVLLISLLGAIFVSNNHC